MQKNAPFITGFVYALLFAAGVCFVFYGGHVTYITHAYLVGLLCMLPFVFYVVWSKRKRDGGLAGREGAKEGMRFVLAATIFMALFQVVFFQVDFKEYKINYMQTTGPQILKEQIAAGKIKLTEAEIDKVIAADVEGVTVFKEITSVVFKNLFFGVFCSFLSAVVLKRKTT